MRLKNVPSDEKVLGIIGPQGERGQLGPKGDHGDVGIRGAEGLPGQTGPKGDRGEQGPEGKPGKDGKPGRAGRDGKPGPIGKDGRDGKDGASGAAGARGASIHLGDNEPDKNLGNDADIHIAAQTGDLWFRIAGKWERRGNIRGKPGESGSGRHGWGGGSSFYQQPSPSYSARGNAPLSVSADSVVTPNNQPNQIINVIGNGGAVTGIVLAAPPPDKCRTVMIIGTNDANTVKIAKTATQFLNGSVILNDGKVISFVWDGASRWVEVSRNA